MYRIQEDKGPATLILKRVNILCFSADSDFLKETDSAK